MRREAHRGGAHRRRFAHAHRVRQPVGPIDERSAPFIGRRGPSQLRVVALAAVVAAAGVAVGVARPWEALGGLGIGSWATPGPVASGLAVANRAGEVVAPTLGPHGDTVAIPWTRAEALPRMRDVRRLGSPGPLPPSLLTGYVWPLRNARITNGYGLGHPGSFEVDGVTYHDGLDISSFCGARVTAAHDGTVLAAGRHSEGFLGWVGDLSAFRAKLDRQSGWGSQAIAVIVDDGNGYRSVYAHLGLTTVEKGQFVHAGELIGYEGASGNATGCHVHYAIYSPLERDQLRLEARLARKTRLPRFEIARIDPLLVLPPPAESQISWGWGAR